jgi:hypothetical protein
MGRIPHGKPPDSRISETTMNTLLLKADVTNENADESTTVTRGMMRKRAIELAINDGRSALEASKSDWEQAKQEFGEQDARMIC